MLCVQAPVGKLENRQLQPVTELHALAASRHPSTCVRYHIVCKPSPALPPKHCIW